MAKRPATSSAPSVASIPSQKGLFATFSPRSPISAGQRIQVQAKGSDLAFVIAPEEGTRYHVYPYHAPHEEIHAEGDEGLRAAIQSIADHVGLGHIKPVYTREGT